MQLHLNVTVPPKTDKKENYTIEEAWINLVQAEDYLVRGITAFLPRIQQEETNPTFEHLGDWDQLNLQEKVNLIIFDNIIKLIELQDCESITGHKENEVHNVSSPSLLGSESSLLGRGPNMEDEDYSYLYDHLELQDGKNATT